MSDAAYAHCEALVRASDKDRFVASLFAPTGTRPHLFALYAFNLEIARVGESPKRRWLAKFGSNGGTTH